MRKMWLMGLCLVLCSSSLHAATYYVDYDAGVDTNAGTSKDTAWKHAPGDTAAAGKAKAVKLAPGDGVKFKGGVVYRGSFSITASGAAGKPIVYDGNSAGDWGEGKAIIDGSVPLTGLKVCENAAEAGGNPNFKNICWTTVPKDAHWNTLNVCQGLKALAVAQDPNPESPIYQENPHHYYKTEPNIPQTLSSIRVRPLQGMGVNGSRPLVAMFDGGRASAVIEAINSGGEVEVSLQAPVTVTAFSVTPQPRYTHPKTMAFLVDGKEILKVEVKPAMNKAQAQRFALPAPVTFKTLVIKFISAQGWQGGAPKSWGAVQAIGAYDANGKNVLITKYTSTYRDEKVFTQADPGFYKNAFFALYCHPAQVCYKPILGFDPVTHEITIEPLRYTEKPYERGGAFSIVNCPRHMDRPGEVALILDPQENGTHKLLIWPYGNTTEGLTRAQQGIGISIRASYVTVQGFWVRKQGWKGSGGIDGRGQATDVIIRQCRVSNLRGRGAAIHATRIDNLVVEDCEALDNAGHTKGIVLRNAKNVITRGCTLRRNSSTAIDYYTVTNGVVQDCLVDDNRGMHANGLTFYVRCRDILVERNLVRNGNVGLTVQDGTNMIIRNNIIEGGEGGAFAIGLWSGGPYNNIVITNNVLRHHGPKEGTSNAAIYGGNAKAKGYAIVDNVIDGLSGNVLSKADIHHNIFTKLGPTLPKAQLGKNLLVEDPAAIFVAPDQGDWRLKPGSPAIGAGVAITSINRYDRIGVDRTTDGKVDIGAFEFVPAGQKPQLNLIKADPHTHRFSFDGYTIAPPPKIEIKYEMRFKRREGKTVVLKGVDRTGEHGGKVNLRTTRGGYISGWDKPGHWLEWAVDAEKAGFYELVIAHASEMPSQRQVLLNGEPVAGLEAVSFPATGAWRTFIKTGIKQALALKAGKNVIRFVNVKGSLNFKTLEFIPVESDQPVQK